MSNPPSNAVNFDLEDYTAPLADEVDFSFVEGIVGKAYQTSYASGQVTQIQDIVCGGHQTSYATEESITRIPGWDTQEEYVSILIDHTLIDEDLYNFPVRVRIGTSVGKTSVDNAKLVLAKLGSEKLKFMIQTAGGIQCYVEIEDWVDTEDWVELHCKVPFIPSNVDFRLILFFDYLHDDETGYVGVIGSTPGMAVWDSNFIQVYHLNGIYDSTAGEAKDSTGNTYHLEGGWSHGIAGTPVREKDLIGYCQYFDGGDDISGDGLDLKGRFYATAEVFCKTDSVTDDIYKQAFSNASYENWGHIFWASHWNTDLVGYIRTTGQAGLPYQFSISDCISANTPAYIALSLGNGIGSLYIDGNAGDVQEVDGSLSPWVEPSNLWQIGERLDFSYDFYTEFYLGNIDEFRVSDIRRSSEWIKATYYSFNDNLLIYSLNIAPFQPVTGDGHSTSYADNDLLSVILPGWNPNFYLDLFVDSSIIDEDLYNFPVRVRLESSVGKTNFDNTWIFNYIGTNKYKIALQSNDTGQQCEVEIEDYEFGSDWAEFHVKAPFISSSYDSVIRFYFDPAHDDNTDYIGITGSVPGMAVWDSNFMEVYHLNGIYDGTPGEVKDSTSNANHQEGGGAGYGIPTREQKLIGYNQVFTPLDKDNSSLYDGWAFDYGTQYAVTMETFSILDNLNYDRNCVANINYNQYQPTVKIASYGPYMNFGILYAGQGSTFDLTSDIPCVLTEPMYVAGTKEAGDGQRLYINGNLNTFGASNSVAFYASMSNGIGYSTTYPDQFYPWDGSIDEVRISDIKRSAAWIKATYHSLNDSLFTYTFPVKELSGSGHQTSYHTDEVFADSIVGKGYQTSYATGIINTKIAIVCGGHQTSYHTDDVTNIIPITCDGHQTSYAIGVPGVKPPQFEPVDSDGHQTSYATGSVTQVIPIVCSGHQTSYSLCIYFVHVTKLDSIVTHDKYEAIVEYIDYEAVKS